VGYLNKNLKAGAKIRGLIAPLLALKVENHSEIISGA
jgi:hypothetical protein